ncbi:MAG: hypothetical protein KDA16_08385 [Phycisphaerales bacterium]|nr:hypothetical protein [Phycisphaerales bacterium]
MMSRLREMYAKLPRAARWALWGLAFVVGYFAVVEPVMDYGAVVSVRADELRAGLDERVRELERRDEVLLGIRERTAWFGDVHVPGDGSEMQSALRDRIDRVFTDMSVPAGWSLDRRTEGRVSREAMSGALGADEELHRLEMEIKFECDPDLAMEVIAELERSPEVTSVPRVVLRKSTEGRRVQATISVEAWSIQKRASAEGA